MAHDKFLELRDKDFRKSLRVDVSQEIVCSYLAGLSLKQYFDDFYSGWVLNDYVVSSIFLESEPVDEILKGEHELRLHYWWALVFLEI